MKRLLIVVIVAVACSGCVAVSHPSPPWRNAILDASGKNLVTMWVQRKDGDEPVILKKDYGMVVVWMDQDRRFYLFDRRAKRYLGTTAFPVFLEELARLPEDIAIEWIDTCCVLRFWEMPDEAWSRLNEVLKKGDRTETRRSENPFIVCICESNGLKYLEAGPPPAPNGEPYGSEATPKREQRSEASGR